MAAGKYNITIEKGSTFKKTITWKDASGNPVNLSGYTARMQLRDQISNVLYTELNNTNGSITFNALYGQILLIMTPTATTALTSQKAVYDLILIDPQGNITRLLEGSIKISPAVTV